MTNFIHFMHVWLTENQRFSRALRSATLEDDGMLKYVFSVYEEDLVLMVDPLGGILISFKFIYPDYILKNQLADPNVLGLKVDADAKIGRASEEWFSTDDYSSVVNSLIEHLDSISAHVVGDPSYASARMIAKRLLRGNPIKVVDIGASPINEPPYSKLKSLGYVDVIGFEPNTDEYNKLRPEGGDIYYNLAIGDGGNHNLNVTRSAGFSSLYEIDPHAISYLNRWQNHVVHDRIIKVDTCRHL